MMNNKLFVVVGILILTFGGILFFTMNNDEPDVIDGPDKTATENFLSETFEGLDVTKSNVDVEKIVSGLGATNPKDGIPALTNPNFVNIDEVDTPDDTQGILLDINGEKKFYPYNILVWHEIVNDTVGGTPVVVTFCPLCGSAIVYEAIVDGETKEFGVSGFLLESNLIMYDRTDTPSLWQQSTGIGIVGDQTDVELTRLPFQLLTIDNIRDNHTDAKILSENTGHTRNYKDGNPYIGYEDTEETFFKITNQDDSFPGKEIFYIIPQADTFIALRQSKLENDIEYNYKDTGLTATRTNSGELNVLDGDGNQVPGYFEMWFSFATQHPDESEIWEP